MFLQGCRKVGCQRYEALAEKDALESITRQLMDERGLSYAAAQEIVDATLKGADSPAPRFA